MSPFSIAWTPEALRLRLTALDAINALPEGRPVTARLRLWHLTTVLDVQSGRVPLRTAAAAFGNITREARANLS